MNYDVNYFIKKYEAIPESQWCSGSYAKNHMRCAIGHCGIPKFNPNNAAIQFSEEAYALFRLFANSKVFYPGLEEASYKGLVININDGTSLYLEMGNSPKERILKALYKIKEHETV